MSQRFTHSGAVRNAAGNLARAPARREAIETLRGATMRRMSAKVASGGFPSSMLLAFCIVLMVIALGLGSRGVWLLVRPPR